MKTTVRKMSFDRVMELPRPQRKNPRRVNLFWRM